MVPVLSASVLAFLLVGLPDCGPFFQEVCGVRHLQICALFDGLPEISQPGHPEEPQAFLCPSGDPFRTELRRPFVVEVCENMLRFAAGNSLPPLRWPRLKEGAAEDGRTGAFDSTIAFTQKQTGTVRSRDFRRGLHHLGEIL